MQGHRAISIDASYAKKDLTTLRKWDLCKARERSKNGAGTIVT